MSTRPFSTPLGAIEETEKTTETTTTSPVPEPVKRQQDIPNGTRVPITVRRKQVYGIKVGFDEETGKVIVRVVNINHRRIIHGFGQLAPRVKDAPPDLGNGATFGHG